MLTARALTATSASGPLTPGTVERRDVGPLDVLIEIAFAGICHSDIHTVRGDWGDVPLPLTVGHEIVGFVTEVGSDVTRHAVGDRVGVGCLVNSCRTCTSCLAGQEQYCLNGNIGTYAAVDVDGSVTQGGYASHVVVDEHFVLQVPEALDLAATAPLLCAGITTYSPLRHWNAGPGTKVAIVGMGGLGHMAVKLAHAMGAEVTVLSQTLSKQEDSKRLGADAYYATSDPATFTDLQERFDLIINTVSAPVDLDGFMSLLALDGTFVALGAATQPMPISLFPVMGRRRSLSGSGIGGIRETQEMLDFCAEHGIASDIELVDAAHVNEAWDRVLASDVRYRFVIDIATLPTA